MGFAVEGQLRRLPPGLPGLALPPMPSLAGLARSRNAARNDIDIDRLPVTYVEAVNTGEALILRSSRVTAEALGGSPLTTHRL